MADLIRPTVWPYSDSAAPEAVAGEKDACGVGFLAQLSGETSHWVLQQALRGLDKGYSAVQVFLKKGGRSNPC